MDEKQKMATAGAALIAAGIGLGIVGASLIVPAVLSWAGRFAEKGADRLGAELEGASRKIGRVAGTLHRSFNEASKAGIGELKRPA
jgi:hypothetical protein